MGATAVGAYLAALRDAKGETQQEVAWNLRTAERNLTTWEQGQRLPHVKTLAELVQYLGGSLTDVGDLLLDEDAGPGDGRAAAARWLRRQSPATASTLRAAQESHRAAALAAELEEFARRIRDEL